MKREVNLDSLQRPAVYSPDWFKISSSMSDTFSECRQKFLYSYVYKIKQRKVDHKLLRRSCVIFASNGEIVKKFGEATNLDRVAWFLASEAKQAVKDLGLAFSWKEWVSICGQNGEHPIESAIKKVYDFPSPENKRWYFSFDDFMTQCINATATIRMFLTRNEIVPLKKDGRTFIQQTLEAPLVIDGQILDETNGSPTIMRAQVNFIDKDMNVYVWRISSKRSSENEMVAKISESIDAQAAVVAHHFQGSVDFPIHFDLRKIVVKKDGDISEVESHQRDVSREEVDDTKRRLAYKAKEIRSMNIFRERSWTCPRCSHYDVCIRRDTSNFIQEVWGDEAQVAPKKKETNDIDDMPW